MPANFPSFDVYRSLYRRNYHGRSIDEFFELSGSLVGRTVLDLCGGDGSLSQKALKFGASRVALVDEQEAMIPPEVEANPNIDVHISSAEAFLSGTKAGGFDRIFCRQAMNYWFNERSAARLAHALSLDGVLVFNTFNQKPPVEPFVNRYELDGRRYVETSWLVDNDVHHVQLCEGFPAHYSWCRWIAPEEYLRALSPYFDVRVTSHEKASLYRCTKR